MGHEQHISFPPFRLDLANERLWHGSSQIPLQPKTFAVLRHMLAEIYNWFTEGFDTKDLQKAKELLEKLA